MGQWCSIIPDETVVNLQVEKQELQDLLTESLNNTRILKEDIRRQSLTLQSQHDTCVLYDQDNAKLRVEVQRYYKNWSYVQQVLDNKTNIASFITDQHPGVLTIEQILHVLYVLREQILHY